jgi:hypothetical protein
MSLKGEILDLSECGEFGHVIRRRPPTIVHGTAILLALLLGGTVLWSYLTKADVVVQAQGRVRPVT